MSDRPQATLFQPLFSRGLGNKYYGLGFFAGKKPVTIFQVDESDAFEVPAKVTEKYEQRKYAIAKLLTLKLKLTRYGREIYEEPEHSYHTITKAVVSKFKVDVDAKVKGSTKEKSATKDAWTEVFGALDK